MTSPFAQHFSAHLKVVQETAAALELQAQSASDAIVKCLANGGKLLTFGNGGSSAEAGHFAEELVGRYRATRRPFPAMSLSSDSGALTCISNDFGYETVFERQVEAFLRPADVAVGLSTSGRSQNVIRALRCARERGGVSIALTGRDGISEVEVDHLVAVSSDNSALIQEVHLILIHVWCDAVDKALAER